ncbi:hypothetical protein [Truepera radiovictrix]|uniref:4-alpha-glucanotransferase n=1 Tax=Truepera radiovictrix (strain DSM 17093 / CIP 108686 / LMG 22925 / RQ-24) TaxID=649638 RepID=D7CXX2_TRURR|nr:hypothetical protein [Truepera radiovictrix]ADI13332.1 putative 4-alpha-glucanotransferase [Truepera radiovictrix DSM 17093]WMT58103.1 hypothetical protein RCV51_03935 [Truepera radiovictrix]
MTPSSLRTTLASAAACSALLASCSFAPIRVPVGDVTIPGNSSAGLICYAPSPITESAPSGFRGADYRADATYTSVGDGPATVRVYGRTTPPESPCVFPSDADVPLSEPITLTPGVTQRVLIGGPNHSGALAELIAQPRYYLGASLTGGVLFSAEEWITLTNGEVSVYY